MDLEEFYTPVSRHFGDGCNTEIFWAKCTLFILRYVFGGVGSDGSSYYCEKSIVPMRVQVLKHKTGYLIFGMMAPQATLKLPETSKRVEWVNSKIFFLWIHTTCILLQSFHLKPPPFHNFKVIVVVQLWALLELQYPAPITGFLSEIYLHPLLEGTVSRSTFRSIDQV